MEWKVLVRNALFVKTNNGRFLANESKNRKHLSSLAMDLADERIRPPIIDPVREGQFGRDMILGDHAVHNVPWQKLIGLLGSIRKLVVYHFSFKPIDER